MEITIVPSLRASLLAKVVARVHASLDGRVSDRLCRIIRGGCVCHEVGGGVYTVGVGCPPWLIFPVIRNAGLLSHRTYRGRVATRGRHEAARGVHAALQDDEGDEEGAEGRSLD